MSVSVEVENKKIHFRHLMLFYFVQGTNAAQTAHRINLVYGQGVLSARTVCKWFAQFKSGNYDLEDRERSGRPSTVDDEKILAIIQKNPDYSTRKIAEILQVSHASVKRHLQSLKYVPKRVVKTIKEEKT